MTQEIDTANGVEALIAKIGKMIAAQTAGEVTGFSTDNLNQVYLSLVEGSVDEDTNTLLIKMVGPDWAKDYELAEDDGQEEESEAMNMALTQAIEQIDETNPVGAINTLASALMVACRELGWLEASRAAHDQWFYSDSPT
jgi:hypothetical protein